MELSTLEENLSIAHDTISKQDLVIKQKNQRINRLMRDKINLSARLACLKHDLVQAVLCASTAEELSNSHSIQIETFLSTIQHINRRIKSQRQEKIDLQKSLKSTRMREKRAKSGLKATRTSLKLKSTF
jgi:septal ring factor EnvC (AmiA/AmiB activator)